MFKAMSYIPLPFRQLFRFGIVGGFSTLVNSVLFLLMVDVLYIQPLLANLFAFFCAFFVSYFGHSYWTFASTPYSKEKLMKFLGCSLIALGLNSFFVWILMHFLHQAAYVTILPMIFVTPLLVFAISKYWVFHEKCYTPFQKNKLCTNKKFLY